MGLNKKNLNYFHRDELLLTVYLSNVKFFALYLPIIKKIVTSSLDKIIDDE